MAFPRKRIEGVLAATFTPLTDEGELNVDIIPRYVDHLVAHGVKGVFVNGTTGEGLNFTVDERKQIAEKWITCAKGTLEIVIIQIGGSNLEESKDLARHAEAVGADAIAALPPVYFKPKNVPELVTFMKMIAESAPKTPLYYYHIPMMSGVALNMESFFEEAEKKVPTFSGAKFTSTDLLDFSQCLHFRNQKYQLFYGGDDILLGALALGAKTSIGSTYNFCGKIVNEMMAAFKEGDLETARRLQLRVQDLVKVFLKHGGNSAALKALMNLLGLNVGPPRLPLQPLNEPEMLQLEADLKILGFL